MSTYSLFKNLLWFAPLLLLLAHQRRSMQGESKKIFDFVLPFFISFAFFTFLKGPQELKYSISWIYILMLGCFVLPFFFLEPKKKTPKKSSKQNFFFTNHPDILYFYGAVNGVLTLLLFLAQQHGSSLPIILKLTYSGIYTAYVLIPFFILYRLFFKWFPQRALWLLCHIEALRLSFLSLNLYVFSQIQSNLPSAKAVQWLSNWQRYPDNDNTWTSYRFILFCGFTFLLILGFQTFIQWLYLHPLKKKHFQNKPVEGNKNPTKNPQIDAKEIATLAAKPFLPKQLRFLLGFGSVLLFLSSAAWISIDPNIETSCSRQFPLFEKLHFDLKPFIFRYDPKEKFAKRKKKLQYPLLQAKELQLKQKPDILLLLIDPLGSEALQTQHFPSFLQANEKNIYFFTHKHVGGSGQQETGLFSLLYGLHSYRKDLFKKKTSWPLKALKAEGYQLKAFIPENSKPLQQFLKTAGFEEISQVSDKRSPQNSEIFSQLQKQLAPKQPTTTRSLKPKVKKPKLILAVVKLSELSQTRSKVQCSNYHKALQALDQQLARLWKTSIQHRVKKDLIVVFTGKHGWFEQKQPQPADLLKNAHVPMLLLAPSIQKRKSFHSSSHADIFPTLFGLLHTKIPSSAYSDGLHIGSLHEDTHREHIVGQALSKSKGLGFFSFPYNMFVRWGSDMRFNYHLSHASHGSQVILSRSVVQSRLQNFRTKFHRYSEQKNFWNKALHHHNPQSSKRLSNISACTHRTFKQQKLSQEPFLPNVLHTTFGETLRIVGYELNKQVAKKGDLIKIRVTMQALKAPTKKWRLFTHLSAKDWFLNLDGEVFTKYPLKDWKAGDFVQGIIQFKMPVSKKVYVYMGMWSKSEGRITVHGDRVESNKRMRLVTIYPSVH